MYTGIPTAKKPRHSQLTSANLERHNRGVDTAVKIIGTSSEGIVTLTSSDDNSGDVGLSLGFRQPREATNGSVDEFQHAFLGDEIARRRGIGLHVDAGRAGTLVGPEEGPRTSGIAPA